MTSETGVETGAGAGESVLLGAQPAASATTGHLTPAAHEPVAYLLAGLPGAGKTTYALALAARGAVRLSVDERVLARHGVVGLDFAPSEYFVLAAPIVDDIGREVAGMVRQRRTVVVDHGLDTRAERDAFKAVVTGNGGRWQLIYFRADRATLLDRLAARNAAGGVGEVTPRMLDWLAARWEEPRDEGELILDQA